MMKTILGAILVCLTAAMVVPTNCLAQAQAGCTNTGAADNQDTSDKKNTTPGDSDPIDMATGEFSLTHTDLSLPGPMPLTFTRIFNNRANPGGYAMGCYWSDNCHRMLTFGSAGAGYIRGDGISIPIYYDSHDIHGAVTNSHGTSKQRPYYTLVRNTDGTDVVTDKYGNSDYFIGVSAYGAVITKSVDRNGNELDYTYSTASNGLIEDLIKVEDPVSSRYITFAYNADHNISSITDSAGRTVTYNYVNATNGGLYRYLSEVIYPATTDFPSGTSESFAYDTDENLTTITDGNNNVIVTNVWGSGNIYGPRIIQQTVNGATGNISYDDTDSKVTFTDYKGYKTDYYNDGNGNITKQIVYAPSTPLHANETASTTFETDYTYGTGTTTVSGTIVDGPAPDTSKPNNCYKIQETDPNGNGTKWTYDSLGNILTATKFLPSGSGVNTSEGTQAFTSTTTYTYDSRVNQVKTMTDPNGNVTTYDYGNAINNPGGNLLSITYPTTAAGTAHETFTYNSKGQVLTDTAPDGTVTKNTYDATTGYLTQSIKDYGTGKLNATTNYTYDSYGHVATVQDPNGNTTTMTTNAMDQVTEIDGASGEVEQRSYDGCGHVLTDKKQAPGSQWQQTVNVYNAYQQLTETHNYTDASTYLTTSFTYDVNGNQITVTDPLGHTITTAYDERNKPYQITDALGHTVTYDFDGNGNTIKLTDELGHATTYTFDGMDRLEQKTFPDSSYQTWKFDAAGNITGLRTTAGNTISQTYDTRNRMLTQNYGSTITNTYDIVGRLLTTSEGGTSLTYVYDALGRNTSFTDQAGRTSTYTYDLDGNRLNSTYPTSIVVKKAYDSSNRLSTLKDGSNATQATYSYDILDRTTGVSLANSTSVAYSYDLLNRLSYVHNTLVSGNRNYTYVYDNASRITSTTEPRGTISSGYTDRDEVNSITEPSGSPFADQSFIYDAAFNRSSWTLGSSTKTYTANNLNQYTAISSTTAPTWNSDGGLATYAGNTYTYDALQRVTEIDYSGGKTLFSYDPMGRRVKKIDENGSGTVLSTVQYHYDGSAVAVEYQPSTTWTYFGGVMRTDGTNKQWYYRDGHGSTSAVADNSGDLLEAYEYTAQGHIQITNASATVISASAIANDILYCGYRYDSETGNYFCNARYYNPVLGRFISRDPLSGAEFSQGTNLYAYCRNNFLNATDPTGQFSFSNFLRTAVVALWGAWASVTGGAEANDDSERFEIKDPYQEKTEEDDKQEETQKSVESTDTDGVGAGEGPVPKTAADIEAELTANGAAPEVAAGAGEGTALAEAGGVELAGGGPEDPVADLIALAILTSPSNSSGGFMGGGGQFGGTRSACGGMSGGGAAGSW